MRASSGPSDGVPPMEVDEQTVDRLLSGALDPDDAPPGYGEVAALLRAAAPWPQAAGQGSVKPGTAEGAWEGMRSTVSAREQRHIRAMVAAISAASSETGAMSKQKRRRSTPTRAKLGALVLAALLFATTGLALAGDLPPAAQHFAAEVLSKIEITVPNGRQSSSTVTAGGQTGTPAPHLASLCADLFSGPGGRNISGDHSTALRSLQNAARAAGQSVQDLCRRATSVARRSAHHSRARPGNGNNRGHPQPPPKSHASDQADGRRQR